MKPRRRRRRSEGCGWRLELAQKTAAHSMRERRLKRKKKPDRSHTAGSPTRSLSHSPPHSCRSLTSPLDSQTKEEETAHQIRQRASTNDPPHHSQHPNKRSRRANVHWTQGRTMRKTTASIGQWRSSHNTHSQCSSSSHTRQAASSSRRELVQRHISRHSTHSLRTHASSEKERQREMRPREREIEALAGQPASPPTRSSLLIAPASSPTQPPQSLSEQTSISSPLIANTLNATGT
jgi:hypothetical protein